MATVGVKHPSFSRTRGLQVAAKRSEERYFAYPKPQFIIQYSSFKLAVMKAAIIFDNFGPYHLARIRAAAQACDLTAIEIAGRSAEYAWDGRDQVQSGEGEGLKCITLFQQGTSHGAGSREIAGRIESALDNISPLAVFIPGWSSPAAFAALNWCVRRQVPAIMMSESTAWDDTRISWREAVKRRLVGLCRSALVGGLSHEDYIVKLGMLREQVFLGYDAVDNQYFSQEAEKSRMAQEVIREKFALPRSYFLASARFIEKKNLPRLLKAYAGYRQLAAEEDSGGTKPPWDLVLLGDGELRASLLELRASFSLENCVHLPGFIQYPDLPAYYGLAKAFIHASTTEQWGLVVNEAMASGLPVLVSNRCGCAANLVQDGVNGFTFDPSETQELVQLMMRISAPGFPLAELGEASRMIISDWGTERFGSGVKAAVDCAVEIGSRPASLFDRTLLAALARK